MEGVESGDGGSCGDLPSAGFFGQVGDGNRDSISDGRRGRGRGGSTTSITIRTFPSRRRTGFSVDGGVRVITIVAQFMVIVHAGVGV